MTISSAMMRQQMLDELRRRAGEVEDWRQVIGVEGNRRLLSLIATVKPTSVAELAAQAERAQSNVSRSLAKLVKAGLVELTPTGRASVPVLTALGQEKVAALDLAPAAVEERAEADAADPAMFEVAIEEAAETAIHGSLHVRLSMRSRDALSLRHQGDLEQLCKRWANDWWRILYRRDTPYRLCTAAFTDSADHGVVTLLAKSHGRRVELMAREHDHVVPLHRDEAFIGLASFQGSLRSHVLEPVVDALRQAGRPTNAIRNHLARLDEADADVGDLAFFSTAGALGLCPYALDEKRVRDVRELIQEIPEEETRLDFASAVVDEFEEGTRWVRAELQAKGERNHLPGLAEIRNDCALNRTGLEGLKPYERGLELARRARQQLRLGVDASIGTASGLAALFGAPDYSPSDEAPGALLAYQAWRNDVPVVVSGTDREQSPFTLARAVGDHLAFGERQACVADIYTDRQAVGRAFAAEFIAPAEAVVAMIEENGASEYRVAKHFRAPIAAIRHQYNNNVARYRQRWAS